MRKFLGTLLAILLVQSLLTGCSSSAPKEVAQNWLTSFYRMDFDAAKKLSTEDAKKMLATFEILTPDQTDSFKKELKKVTVKVKNVRVLGDSVAVATYVMTDVPDKEERLNLVKQSGKWLVQYSKSDNRTPVDTSFMNMDVDTTNSGNAPAESTLSDSSKR